MRVVMQWTGFHLHIDDCDVGDDALDNPFRLTAREAAQHVVACERERFLKHEVHERIVIGDNDDIPSCAHRAASW